jgi:hypothetical protein
MWTAATATGDSLRARQAISHPRPRLRPGESGPSEPRSGFGALTDVAADPKASYHSSSGRSGSERSYPLLAVASGFC